MKNGVTIFFVLMTMHLPAYPIIKISFDNDSINNLANKFMQHGDSLFSKQNLIASTNSYLLASNLFILSDNWEKYVKCLKIISYNYSDGGNYTEAKKYVNKGIDTATKYLEDTHTVFAELLNALGYAYRIEGNLHESISCYKKAIKINTKYGSSYELAVTLNNLGISYRLAGYYNKSLDALNECKNIIIPLLGPNHANVAWLYSNIALVYENIDDFFNSLEYTLKAKEILTNQTDFNKYHLAPIYTNLGNTYIHLKEYKTAIEYHQQAVFIRESNKDFLDPTLSYNYMGLGIVYKRLGEFKKASEYYQKAMNIKINVFGKEHFETAISYMNLGSLYVNKKVWCTLTIEQKTEKKDYFLKAIDIFSKSVIIHHNAANAWIGLGIIYTMENNYDKGVECFYKSFNLLYPEKINDINDWITNPDLINKVQHKSFLLDSFTGLAQTYYERFSSNR